ncbi:MAG: hypothetical protein Roseis2KO_43300 [Roseivirga sp.]
MGALAVMPVVGNFLTQPNQPIFLRKNIEHLTKSELDKYITALELLGDEEFERLADIHGDYCMFSHGYDIFFPWHRSLLYTFEKALQAKVPGVTIPYYDYTEMPSGKRFPKAFEEAGSILNKRFSGTQFVKNNRRKGSVSTPFYDFENGVIDVINKNPNWYDTNTMHGGSANGFAGKRTGSGKGAIESPQHDTMHFSNIGGVMGSTDSAALDPIFWSFHAYQDLIFELWLKKYGSKGIPEQERPLKKIDKENVLSIRDIVDTRELGYLYDHPEISSPGSSNLFAGTITAHAGSYAQLNPHVARRALNRETFVIQSEDVIVTENSFMPVTYSVDQFQISDQFNYSGFIFLHPKGKSYELSELFIERYLIDNFSVLSMRKMSKGEMQTNMSFDLTEELNRLSEQSLGAKYTITITLLASEATTGKFKPLQKNTTRFFKSTSYNTINQ